MIREFLELKGKSTEKIYRLGFRKFNEWYEGTLDDFLNVIYEEMQKPPREQGRVAERTVNRWLQ